MHIGPQHLSLMFEKAECPIHYLRIREKYTIHFLLFWKNNQSQCSEMNQTCALVTSDIPYPNDVPGYVRNLVLSLYTVETNVMKL